MAIEEFEAVKEPALYEVPGVIVGEWEKELEGVAHAGLRPRERRLKIADGRWLTAKNRAKTR